MAIITTIHIVIQAAGLIELFQYPIRIEAALVLKEGNKQGKESQQANGAPQFGRKGDSPVVPIIPTE